MGKSVDITGQKFGRLTALYRVENKYYGNNNHATAMWHCICECGNECDKSAVSLRQGKVKSCGCYFKDRIREANTLYNKYNFDNDEYIIGYTNNKNPYGKNEFYIDYEMYDRIKEYTWFFNPGGYLMAKEKNSKKDIFMHRLIMDILDKPELIVDHIKGKYTRNDNRLKNLRIATMAENVRNSGLQSNNTSGVIGVYWNKKEQKWKAQINYNYKRIFLGTFENFTDAVKARKEAEEKYFGEYSYDNSMRINND